jgi:hypothetical protein
MFSASFPPRPNTWGLVALNVFYGLAPKPFSSFEALRVGYFLTSDLFWLLDLRRRNGLLSISWLAVYCEGIDDVCRKAGGGEGK